jgi:ATP-dependent Clp protease, protease subunit
MNRTEIICLENPESRRLVADELLYIFVTKFDEESVSKFYEQFLRMSSNPQTTVIPIVISSFGGQIHSLLPMIDIIKASKKPVATIALGKAMSCGAFLLAAGTEGYRYAAPNADIMIHEVSGTTWDKSTNIQNDAKHIKYLNDLLFKFMAEWSGKKDSKFFLNKLKQKSNIDWYLTAIECKKLGLIDHICVPNLIKR